MEIFKTNKFINFYIFFFFLFLFIMVFPIKIFASNFYLGLGFIGSTSYPIIFSSNFDSYNKIYTGESFLLGILFPLRFNNYFGIDLAYLSRGIYSSGEFYFNFFTTNFKLYFSKNIIKKNTFSMNFNFGLWFSFLFYSVYKNRAYTIIFDVLDITNFNYINFGIYQAYLIRFNKLAFEININTGFIDEYYKDSIYQLSTWIGFNFLFFI